MTDATQHPLLARLTERVPAMLADLQQLVTCESPSSDHLAIARSAQVVAGLGERLTGLAPERLVVDGCTHLRWQFGTRPSRVLLLGHHDTVWPIGSLATHPWSTTGGVARGPGSFDMLAGLVQLFHALACLDDLRGVAILVTGDEELGSPTSRALVEDAARGCEAVLVLEGSADQGALKTARKGVSRYALQVQGRAAHAGLEPERGANAGVELAHQVLELVALNAPAAGTTVVPTVLSAGTSTNTVPAIATVAVDVRACDAGEQQRIDAAIHRLTPRLTGTVLEIEGGVNRPPLSAELAAPLFARAQHVAGVLGIGQLRSAAVGGASDGNLTAGVGTQTLDGLGAVGGGSHSATEHVVIEEMPRRAALVAALVASLSGATEFAWSEPTSDRASSARSES